jgi:hypothetical protein
MAGVTFSSEAQRNASSCFSCTVRLLRNARKVLHKAIASQAEQNKASAAGGIASKMPLLTAEFSRSRTNYMMNVNWHPGISKQ